MKPGQLWWAMSVLLAAGGCATAPSAPDPITFGRTQVLVVRSDPPGAACTVRQRGEVVATVEVTPGVAEVSRDFKRPTFEFAGAVVERPPLEISCRMDGYLEFRRQFDLVEAWWVLQEESALQPRPEPTPEEAATHAAGAVVGAAGVAIAGAATAASGPLGMALVASGGAVLAPVAAIAIVGFVVLQDLPKPAHYAYRPLPELVLVPAQFGTTDARDAFFADLEAKLRGSHAQMHARIDANCWYQPCKPSDARPCQDPWCLGLREVADAQLKAELDHLSAARAQVRIGAGPE